MAVHTGRFLNGIIWDTTTKLPVRIPALPSPAIDRPIMRVMELGAIPQIKDPTKNIPRDMRYDHFILKSMKMRPYNGWNADAVRRYEEPYHPMSSGELNSLVMKGIALNSVNTCLAKDSGLLPWLLSSCQGI